MKTLVNVLILLLLSVGGWAAMDWRDGQSAVQLSEDVADFTQQLTSRLTSAGPKAAQAYLDARRNDIQFDMDILRPALSGPHLFSREPAKARLRQCVSTMDASAAKYGAAAKTLLDDYHALLKSE